VTATRTEGVTSARQTVVRALAVALLIVMGALLAHQVTAARTSGKERAVPQSAAMEDALGIRISRIAVVGDGGLITMSYVVLDAEKAAKFQVDSADPPVLTSESRDGGTSRVSLMRQGHNLRAGQTYYLVYQNTKGAIKGGEEVTVTKDDLSLEHVPVL
jgi:hypothetical protein